MSSHAKFWVLLGLLFSNVIVGAVGLRALAKLDRSYTELIELGLPTLNTLRAMTRDLAVIQRASLRAVLSDHPTERADQTGRIRAAREKIALHQTALQARRIVDHGPLQDFLSALERYDAATALVLGEVDRDKAEAARIQREQMRDAYDDLLEQLDAVAESTVRSGKTLSQQYSGEARRFTHVLMALSGWPLALIGIGLLFALALGLFLLFAYRAVGTPEQP